MKNRINDESKFPKDVRTKSLLRSGIKVGVVAGVVFALFPIALDFVFSQFNAGYPERFPLIAAIPFFLVGFGYTFIVAISLAYLHAKYNWDLCRFLPNVTAGVVFGIIFFILAVILVLPLVFSLPIGFILSVFPGNVNSFIGSEIVGILITTRLVAIYRKQWCKR